jgi:GNAT superfamily N-acetyltransferase
MSNRIRPLTTADVPQAMALSRAASWNQTADDWRLAIEMNPEGCFAIESDGMVTATTTTIRYGTDLAWIGMVLTHPEFRGLGFARSLMQCALHHLSDVRTVKLDATEMGEPLYRQCGFVEECPIERWVRQPASAPSATVDGYAPNPSLDRDAFGADRALLLDRLARIESASLDGAFAMTRGNRFGPCVSRSSDGAVELLHWALSRHSDQAMLWDTFPSDLPKLEGFELSRRLKRMTRGAILRGDESLIYAGAGFEFG